jgi:hypothetical protein
MFAIFARTFNYRSCSVPLIEVEHCGVVAKITSQVIAKATDVDNSVRGIVVGKSLMILSAPTTVRTLKHHRNCFTGVRKECDEVLAHDSGTKLVIKRSIVDKSCKHLPVNELHMSQELTNHMTQNGQFKRQTYLSLLLEQRTCKSFIINSLDTPTLRVRDSSGKPTAPSSARGLAAHSPTARIWRRHAQPSNTPEFEGIGA